MNYADFAFNYGYDFNTKISFRFDADAMKNDLRKFLSEDWIPHFNASYYEGDWSGIALRAPRNAALQLYPDPTAEGYENTKMLARWSYYQRVIDAFKCEAESVRRLRRGCGNSRASG